MTQTLTELADKVWRQVGQGVEPETSDVNALISMALSQKETLSRLATENESLTKENAELKAKVESLEPFSHLVQYAEETN
jgi:predicted RNase H-like nuclease (RuvC/YqgF family)